MVLWMVLPEKYSAVLRKEKEQIPGMASDSHCHRPMFISRSSKIVAVQETDSKSRGRNVRASVITGPYKAPRFPLTLNRKNCTIGMYAAISGSSC